MIAYDNWTTKKAPSNNDPPKTHQADPDSRMTRPSTSHPSPYDTLSSPRLPPKNRIPLAPKNQATQTRCSTRSPSHTNGGLSIPAIYRSNEHLHTGAGRMHYTRRLDDWRRLAWAPGAREKRASARDRPR